MYMARALEINVLTGVPFLATCMLKVPFFWSACCPFSGYEKQYTPNAFGYPLHSPGNKMWR